MHTNTPHTLNEAFRAGFAGDVIAATDDGYDEARSVWNGTVDARPALVARCRSVDDIAAGVAIARAASCDLAVRAGGHSVAGLSVCNDGVVLDLRAMNAITVDPERRTAMVGPGATWAELDAATAAHGLGCTGGLVSTTGVAGLTLGGGIGWLQRKHGLSCDNLIAADLVTADGEVVHTSESERPELLWGLRGGGGNFGIVAQFEFRLHPVSTVLGGLMLFTVAQARDLLTTFRDWAPDAPDDASMLVAIMTAPPEPFVPTELQGQTVIGLVGCWCGDLDAGTAAIAPFRALGPAVDVFGPMPYVALQGLLDAGAPKGLRNYFRSGFLDDLDDEVIDVLLDHGARLPSPMSGLHLHQMGGAVGRVSPAQSAFSGRSAAYTYNIVSTWVDPAEDDVHITANRAFAEALAPLAAPGRYVNFIAEEGADPGLDPVRSAYGSAAYERLSRLKREYDPANLFHRNQNVAPAR
jgi:hypothetical protein